jgi:hypothetical protein
MEWIEDTSALSVFSDDRDMAITMAIVLKGTERTNVESEAREDQAEISLELVGEVDASTDRPRWSLT